MHFNTVDFIKIDENGDAVDYIYVSCDNIYYIMDSTWDFTEEEVRAKGFAPVKNSKRDYVNGDEIIEINPGEIIKNEDGSFTQLWIEEEIDAGEKRARWFEIDRGAKLLHTDWTQMPDSPLSDELKEEYRIYRQKLRDMPSTIDFASLKSDEEIEWPLLPGVVTPDPGTPLPEEESGE